MLSGLQSIGVSLAELFPQCRFHYARDIRVTSCCVDAEKCRSGDLYVALMSPDADGHLDAERAIECGATAVLTERLLPVEIPQCIVTNSSRALSKLCQRLAGEPAEQVHIMGVAGHRGKTATHLMLTGVLTAGGHMPAMFGRLGYTDGIESSPAFDVPSTASQYARWLARVVSRGCSHAVTEMSRASVARHTYSSVPLRMLLLGGLTTSTHRSAPTPKTRTYVRRMLGQLRPGSMVVANIDCPVVGDLVRRIDHPVLAVSAEQPADVTATRLEQYPSEQIFLLEAGEQTSVVRTKLIGDTHLYSCLLAAAAGLGAGIELATSVRAIESVESIPGQLERVECGQPFSVFADSTSSASKLRDTLITLREVTQRRLICVFGAGESGRPELSALRGSVVERYADLGVITSDVAAEPEPLRVAHEVLDGYRQPSRAHVMPNRTRAIAWAIDQAQPGDAVLLAGPHNRRIARSDHDFPADADVARLHLFDHAGSYQRNLEGSQQGYWSSDLGPSWN